MEIKFKDILIIFLIPLFTVPFFIANKLTPYSFLTPCLIFFGLPSFYMLYKKPSAFTRAVLFGLIAIPSNYLFDAMATEGNVWINVSNFPTFPGGVAVEVLIGAFLVAFNIALFSQVFVKVKPNLKLKDFLFIAAPVLTFIFISFLFFTKVFEWTYYIIGIGLSISTLIITTVRFPNLIKVLLTTSILYFPLFFACDFINARQGFMTFPGKFLYVFNFNGVLLPFEEIFFLVLLGGASICCLYLYVMGSEKK
jgi:hypothetical protein